MVSNINDDRIALASKVEDALTRLVRQTLVQKNGDIYVFLTDEEQEINRAIESQNVESSEIINKVSELIFDGLYDEKKYRYPAFNGRYAFAFNQFVDDKPYKANQSHDITLKILTPNSDELVDDATLRLLSGQSNIVLVVLPGDRSFLDEIRSALQIEKFIRYDTTNSLTKFEVIKEAKKIEMRDRSEAAKNYLSESLKESRIYVNFDEVKTTSKDITTRINEAIGKLVANVYHKLDYIDVAMNESDIRVLFKSKSKQLTLLEDSKIPNMLALDEVKEYISTNTKKHVKTSMKTLLDRYLKAPYGFVETDVQWIVAKLFKDGDISLFVNNEAINLISKSEDDIIRYITRKEFNEKLMAEIKIKANEKQKKSVKEVMKELFGFTFSSEDDDAMMKSFLEEAGKLKEKLDSLYRFYEVQPNYPGKQIISKGKTLMLNVLQMKYSQEFFNYIDNGKDEYLEFAEDYEIVKNFFEGNQKDIFDKALKLMRIYDNSKNFVVNNEIEKVVSEINEIIRNANPYGQIFRLPDLLDKFNNLYDSLLEEKKKPVDEAIQDAMKRVFNELDGKLCYDILKDKFIKIFEEIRNKAEICNDVAVLQSIISEVDKLKVRFLNQISSEEENLINLQKLSEDKSLTDEKVENSTVVPVKKIKSISFRSINNSLSWQLETEADVKKYIEVLEKQLINSLEKNTIINIEF